MVKKVGKYELGRTLGEGTFGKVKYAINTETQEAVAIKVLDKEKIQKQNMGNQIKKEISIMKMVKHKYVVGMIEVLASKSKIFIVLELVTGGELFDKIVRDGKLQEDQALFYLAQLVEGVAYCHKLGVCHRDLKPENLLLDENGNLKISDFGLSSLYVGDANGDGASRTEILHTTCGTPNYVAPEVLADKGYDGKKADVWSIGVILYVLMAGFLPFDESSIVALFQKIQNADFTYPKWFSMEIRQVIDLMLVSDPAKRVSLKELKAHAWLQEKLPNFTEGEDEVSPETVQAIAAEQGGFVGSGSGFGEGDDNAPDVPSEAASPQKASHKTSSPKSAEEVAALMEKPKSFYPNKGPAAEAASNFADLEASLDESLGATLSRPKILSAFDLINQVGGFALDKLFSPAIDVEANASGQLVKKLSSKHMIAAGDAGASPAKEDMLTADDKRMLSRTASVRVGGASNRRTGSYHYSSTIDPPTLMKSVYKALKDIGFTLDSPMDGAAASGKCKGTMQTPAKGMIGVNVFVYTLCSTLSLLEIRRARGNPIEWNKVYEDLVNNRIRNLINLPSGEGEAKADSSPRPGYAR